MIWLNGSVLPASEARIDPADRGFLLGDGVFETIRVTGRHPWHLRHHLARLRAGAAALRIVVAWDEPTIREGIAAVLLSEPDADAVLRLTLTRGAAPRGLLPAPDTRATLLIAASALPPALPPARAIVATCTRRNEHSPLSRIKSLNYLDSILARQEAAARDADEAILLNTRGFVAEAAAGNVFLALDGRLVTPPIEDGALPGIARGLILAKGLAEERHVARADLESVRYAVVTSSLAIRPLASIEGTAIGAPPEHAVELLDRAVGPEREANGSRQASPAPETVPEG